MSLAVVAGVACLVVVVTGGSFEQLFRSRIQSIWMVVVALAIQIVLAFVHIPADRLDDLGFALVMVSFALLLAFCFVNIRVSMMWVIAVGIGLNALVIGLNRGMPTADNEVTRGGRTVEEPIERTAKHRPESDDDLLPFLGDRLRVPAPIDELVSVGDIVIGIGVVLVFYQGSRVRRRRPRTRAARMARIAARMRERDEKPAPVQTFATPAIASEQALKHDSNDDTLGLELDQVFARLAADEHNDARAKPEEGRGEV